VHESITALSAKEQEGEQVPEPVWVRQCAKKFLLPLGFEPQSPHP